MKTKDYIQALCLSLSRVDENAVSEFASILSNTIRGGFTIFICGNGGSAANAAHIKNDFVKLVFDRTGYPVNCICLNDNVSLMTAITNDEDYKYVFSGQLGRMSVSENNVLLVLTGSGNSCNVVDAAQQAGKYRQMCTLALTGMDGGHIVDCVDHAIIVESDSMQIIEDIHLAIGHMLTLAIIDNLKPTGDYSPRL